MSIVIPTYNSNKYIEKSLEETVDALQKLQLPFEILILDDILSQMDTDSILNFQDTFDSISKNRTVILISREIHHLSMCKKFMFFSGPTLSQFGPTLSVLNQAGPAQDLMKKQLRVISPKFEQNYGTLVKSIVS